MSKDLVALVADSQQEATLEVAKIGKQLGMV